MCFPLAIPIAMAAAAALSSLVSQKMRQSAENNAAATNYNNQARYAERVNAAALAQQQKADSRARLNAMQQAGSAAEKARQLILDNQRAMSTARASAGTSGMMGLPLNMIDQTYNSLIGGVSANLTGYNRDLNQNMFFEMMDNALKANATTNQAISGKPYMQQFGLMNWAAAGLSGVEAGLAPKKSSGTTFGEADTFNAEPGDIGSGNASTAGVA